MGHLSLLNPNFKPAFDGKAIAVDLIKKIQTSLPLVQAYLFGSCLEGRNTENSDIDILLVVPDSAIIMDY